MRVLFVLPGLHRVMRGAETAFEQLGKHLAMLPGHEITLIGSGKPKSNTPYHFQHVPCIPREAFEKWLVLPYLRGHYVYEEMTFASRLLTAYRSQDYDVTVTCSYPYINWLLRAKRQKRSPRHIFVTQNGDWMCYARQSEFRHFGCDGLVCTNPEYFERNQNRYPSTLIPNGVDPTLFTVGKGNRAAFNLPETGSLVLMVSALIPSKRVIEGIRAVAQLSNVCLAIAGDGELRHEVQALGEELLGKRFKLVSLPQEKMPELYRCADVFLHMSQDEPFGIAYLEALSTGLPIVTHDRRVTRWTLEDCAVLVDTSNELEVASGICQALKQTSTEEIEQRQALVERRYTWSRLAEQYSEFFEKICKIG